MQNTHQRLIRGSGTAGPLLLRTFVDGVLQPEQLALSDAELQQAVYQDLRQLLGISGEPLCMSVTRHLEAMPQYHVGHLDRVTRIEILVQCLPGLVLAVNAYHGVSIPDCIHSAETAAQAFLEYLATTPAL